MHHHADLAPASSTTPVPHHDTGSDREIDFEAVEQEMARVKAQKERLNAIQALEDREEQLRKVLEAKKQ